MASQASLQLAQTLYVAYYGRPADRAGLEFWATQIDEQGIDAVINDFGNSAEFAALSAGLTDEQLVNNLYNQLFNRDAELEGLEFYTSRLTSGELTLAEIALTIAQGAQNEDADILANKVAVADEFTAAIDTTDEVLAYQGDAAAEAARDFLAEVGADDSPNVDAFLLDLVNGAVGNPGETFVLTSGTDQVEGTNRNDTILAPREDGAATLNAFDQIDGGDGFDTLRVEGLQELQGSIESVERVYIEASEEQLPAFSTLDIPSFGPTYDASDVGGLEQFWFRGFENQEFVPEVPDNGLQPMAVPFLPPFGVVNLEGDQTVGVEDSENFSLMVETDSTTANLALNNASVMYGIQSTGDAPVDTLNVSSVGEDQLYFGMPQSNGYEVRGASMPEASSLSGLRNVNLAATGSLLVAGDALGDEGEDLFVDGSASTGDLHLGIVPEGESDLLRYATEISTGGGDDTVALTSNDRDVSVETGAGDDLIIFDIGAFGLNDSVDAGDGDDLVFLGDTSFETEDYDAINQMQNVEALGFYGEDSQLNAAEVADFQKLVFTQDGNTVENLAEGQLVSLQGEDATDLTLIDAAANVAIEVQPFELEAIDRTTDAPEATIAIFDSEDDEAISDTLTLSGEGSVSFSNNGLDEDGDAVTFENIDASGLEGGLTLTTMAGGTAETVLLGSGEVEDRISVAVADTGIDNSSTYADMDVIEGFDSDDSDADEVTDTLVGNLDDGGLTEVELDDSVGSLNQAFSAAADDDAAINGVFFQFEGNTYLFVDTDNSGDYDNADFALQLVGLHDMSNSALFDTATDS